MTSSILSHTLNLEEAVGKEMADKVRAAKAKTAHTPGRWDFACDSYGKVQHSKKACVYTTLKGPDGERLTTVAARIPNWDDARLISAAPEMLAALEAIVDFEAAPDASRWGKLIDRASAAIAKAKGGDA